VPLKFGAISGALFPAPIRPEWILEGAPVARARPVAVTADDHFSSTVWDCTAGRFRWQFRSDEIVHILEGEVHVTDEAGRERALVPGDVALFSRGTTSVWRVPRYVKKLAIHRSAEDPFHVRLARKLGLR
jgi:uncharacterized protein